MPAITPNNERKLLTIVAASVGFVLVAWLATGWWQAAHETPDPPPDPIEVAIKAKARSQCEVFASLVRPPLEVFERIRQVDQCVPKQIEWLREICRERGDCVQVPR